MTISPIGTTCFGWCDVFSLAKKLTILEFIFLVWQIIDNIVYSHQSQTPWWAFGIAFVNLAYFCLEYYGIDKKIFGLIIFGCFARLICTLARGIFSSIMAFEIYFHFGLNSAE